MADKNKALRALRRTKAMQALQSTANLAPAAPTPSREAIFPEAERPRILSPQEQAAADVQKVEDRAGELEKLDKSGLPWFVLDPTRLPGAARASRIFAGGEAITGGDTASKKAAGAIAIGKEAVPALLGAAGGALGAGGKAAYAAGGGKALAKYGGAMLGEIGLGLGAEELAFRGLTKAGMDPNTAAVFSNIGTLPVTGAGMAATAKSIITKAGSKKAQAAKAALDKAASLRSNTTPAKAPMPQAPGPIDTETKALVPLKDARTPFNIPPDQLAARPSPEPLPGVKLTTEGSPERVVTDLVDEDIARQARAEAADLEFQKLLDEQSALPPEIANSPTYLAEMERLAGLRAQARAPEPPTTRPAAADPGPEFGKAGTRELSRLEARERARQIESKLAADEALPEAERALLAAEAEDLRKFGGRGLEDDAGAAAQVEARLFPEDLAGRPEGTVPRSSEEKAMRLGLEEEIAALGEEGVKQRKILDRRKAMTAGRVAAAEAKGAEAENLKALLADIEGRIAQVDDPSGLNALKIASDTLQKRVDELEGGVPARQTTIQSDEPQPLFGENPDITVRPEEPLFERVASPQRRVEPGAQGVLLPSEELLELNYPDLARRSGRFQRAKATGEKAQSDIRGLRERLQNRDLSDKERDSILKRISKLEEKTVEDPALKEWDDAREALESDISPGRKSFLSYLSTSDKRPKKAAVPEASHLGSGNTPAKKWIGPKEVAERMARKESPPQAERQLAARLQSLESQAEEFAARGIESAKLDDALAQTRAQLFRTQARRSGDEATRTLIDKYADEAPPARGARGADGAGGAPPPEGSSGGTPTDTSVPDKAPDGLIPAVKRLLFDSDWAFRNMKATGKDPARARSILADISGRFKEVRALTAVRAARDLSRAWMVDRKAKLGLRYMTPEERTSLFYVLDRNAEPLNDHVDIVATKLREVFNDLASEFEAMGGMTYDKAAKAWRPFARLLDYAPHLTPNVRLLRDDAATRARVMDYMLQTHGIDGQAAEVMIDEYVAMMLDGQIGKEATLTHWLVDSGQARNLVEAHGMLEQFVRPKVRRSSSLEYSRSFDLPFVDTDLQSSLPGWLEHTWRRIGWIEKFGQEIDGGVAPKPAKLADVAGAEEKRLYETMDSLGEMLKELEDAGGKKLSADAAARLDRALDNQSHDETWAAISRFLRSVPIFRLNYLASDNVFQGFLGSTLRGDMSSTLKALTQSFGEEAVQLAERSGSRPIEGLQQASTHPIYFGGEDFSMMKWQSAIDNWMKITGVKATENLNRTITPASAAEYVDNLYKTLDAAPEPEPGFGGTGVFGFTRDDAAFARSELERLNLPVNRRPTDEEMLSALYVFDREVNFEIDPWLRPEWSNTLWGRHVTQFMNWSYQQTRLVWNETYGMLARGIAEKNSNAVARGLKNTAILTTLYPMAGLTARMIRAAMKTGVGMTGAAVGQAGGSDVEAHNYVGDVWGEFEESPGLSYFRSANRLGAFPAVGADLVESLWVRGQFPDSPAVYGDLTEDMYIEIFQDPVEAMLKSAGEEMNRPSGGDPTKPIRIGAAEEVEGLMRSLGAVPEFTVPATQPLREFIRGEREPKPRGR